MNNSPPATQSALTEEAINEWRGLLYRNFPKFQYGEINALCDMALKALPSAVAVASRDEIIEECAQTVERAEWAYGDAIAMNVNKATVRECVSAIRALKERAAPQAETVPAATPPAAAVAAPVASCEGSWDTNGDYWRCRCGTINQTGMCERNKFSSPTAVDSDAAALADEIESVGKGLGILGRSIEGGRELLPEEDALVVRALRALSSTAAVASAPMPASDFRLMSEPEKYGAYAMAYRRAGQLERELATANARIEAQVAANKDRLLAPSSIEGKSE